MPINTIVNMMTGGSWAGTVQERLLEHIVRRTIEGVLQAALHPAHGRRAQQLQAVSEDGGLLAALLNAACTALVDAAVPLTRTFGARFRDQHLVA